MLPHIHIGPFHLPSYSLAVLVGLIAFVICAILIFEKKEKRPQRVTNRVLIISAFGFLALAVSAFFFNSLFHSIEKGRIVLGGITWLGGVLGGFPVMVLLLHRFCPAVKGEALESFSLLVPGITLGHAFGRIGCFLGGCCYGDTTNSIFGVRFPEGSSAALRYPAEGGGSLPVLPTQLFEAVFELLLFLFMLALYKRLKRHFLTVYFFGYGIFRFFMEFLRGDDRGATGLVLSPSQFMSLLLIALGVLLILYRKGVVLKRLRTYMAEQRERRERDGIPLTLREEKAARELERLAKAGVITEEELAEKKATLLHKIE